MKCAADQKRFKNTVVEDSAFNDQEEPTVGLQTLEQLLAANEDKDDEDDDD